MSEARRRWLGLAAVVLLSAVVVVTAFNPAPHTGGDNAGYLALAHGLLTTGSYTDAFDPEGLAHTKYPPVFPAILAFLMWLGARSWVAFKATAAVSTIVAVGFTYLWAERRLGWLGGLGVGVVFALSSAVVYYSHWILSDPLFVALTLGALVSLDRANDEDGSALWLGLGIVGAWLAFFTRSAGLPLVVAIVGWLALRKRWRDLGAALLAIGVPALAWWWRGRGVGVASYGEEFWMVDPYQPALGTVGVFGLVPRVFANLAAYVTTHVPGGIVGQGALLLLPFGVLVTVAAVAGWVISGRDRVGPAELFFPIYAGLILLWPEVWAGDRFALPLYPLLFVYAALALRWLGSKMPSFGANALIAVTLVLVLLPAGRGWLDRARQSSACAQVARAGGAFACYGPQVGGYAEAAAWSGRELPRGSVVMSRKPRHFFLLSGLPSRTFPFDEDPEAQLALADRLGARYVLLDQWDGLAYRYVGAAVQQRPGAFCFVTGFGDPARPTAQLLGILPENARQNEPEASGGVRIAACPDDFVAGPGEGYASSASSGTIPLLVGLDS